MLSIGHTERSIHRGKVQGEQLEGHLPKRRVQCVWDEEKRADRKGTPQK